MRLTSAILAFMMFPGFSHFGHAQSDNPSSRGYQKPRTKSDIQKTTSGTSESVSQVSVSPQKFQSSVCNAVFNVTGINSPIPDFDPSGTVVSQSVTGLAGTNLGSNVSLNEVCFSISHTWVGDLTVLLIAPNGSAITLVDRPGVPATTFGCDGNNLDVCVRRGDDAPMEDECNTAPAITGTWTANAGNDLNDLNISGINPNGLWSLQVIDASLGDTGYVTGFSLNFGIDVFATWIAPDTLCQSSVLFNLSSTVVGTPTGVWSGQGVTGNNLNTSGLSGPVDITYTVANLASGCSDALTYSIFIATPPTASFTSNVVPGSLSVSFTNNSAGGSSFLWDFGDGNTSTLANPTHTYAASGNYSVTLTVTNSCGTASQGPVSISVTGCPNVILNGDMETGPASGTWIEASTNFGTPICDLNCGNGNGTGPFSGNFWAWFGGSAGPFEESSLSQTVTIATGTANLYFRLEQFTCDNPSDFLKVVIDQDTVFTTTGASSLCGQLGYVLQTVNLNAYADGNAHTVTFFSRTYSSNGGPTNFFVDDVELLSCGPNGIEENAANLLAIWPNPASDYTEIKVLDPGTSGNIRITDMQGRVVFIKHLSNQNPGSSIRVNTSLFSKGVYVVTQTSSSAVHSARLVIQ